MTRYSIKLHVDQQNMKLCLWLTELELDFNKKKKTYASNCPYCHFYVQLFTGPESEDKVLTLENFFLLVPGQWSWRLSLIKPRDTPRSETAACIFDMKSC